MLYGASHSEAATEEPALPGRVSACVTFGARIMIELMRVLRNLTKRIFAGLLLLTAIADAAPEPTTVVGPVRYIVLPGRKDALPYSDGVLAGNTLYLAGKIGIDPESGKAPAELEKEIRFLLEGMKATLKEANMTMDDLVSVQIFCPDLSLYEKFNEIYATYFVKNFPARAFIGSGPLLRGGRFEAQGVAVRR
jgi:reactive intermediate/imine deaminase